MTDGGGIQETVCLIESRSTENVTDLTPVSVQSVQVLEVDENVLVIGQTVFTDGPYTSGDSLLYESILANTSEVGGSSPRGLVVSIAGTNAEGQAIANNWAIVFQSNCTTEPILRAGQQIGWMSFVSHVHCTRSLEENALLTFRCLFRLT